MAQAFIFDDPRGGEQVYRIEESPTEWIQTSHPVEARQ